MDEHSLRVLEFYPFLDLLKGFCLSPMGKRRCERLRPSRDPDWIQSRLTEVMECLSILKIFGDLPLEGLKDTGDILRRLEVEGSVLNIRELVEIHEQIALCRGLQRFFQKMDPDLAPVLREKVLRLSNQKVLSREILQTIDPKGEILDRASPALFEIRSRLTASRERIQAILNRLLYEETWQPLLQDQFITLRNGRYVLPIKASYKNRVEGIVHDQSQTQMTIFFEPLQVVTHNNEINLLMGEEKEEEYRILNDLSVRVRGEIESLKLDFEILGDLDLLQAAAKWTARIGGLRPELSEDGRIDLEKARHPLLSFQRGEAVVPIDLRFGEGIRTLILSGANAGGKTVALKTMGLLTLMLQSGVPIPVREGSRTRIFQDVFAVIGDEQNIDENLSTFSSHLLHLDRILNQASPRSLVLIDELGVGTDAQEGSALAMGFLDRFREKKASIIVTTHYDRLKAYGHLHPGIENVAVEFDERTLEPRYTLSYGAAGLSNAFLVAEKLGVAPSVLERARHYREGGGQEVSDLLERLERLRAEAWKERETLHQLQEEVSAKRQKLGELLKDIKRKRQEILSKAEEQAQKSLLAVEEELKAWLRKKKEEKTMPHSLPIRTQRREIQGIKDQFFPPPKKRDFPSRTEEVPKVGDPVRIISLRSDGVLQKIGESENRVEVMTAKGKVKAFLSDIVKIEAGAAEKELRAEMTVPTQMDFDESLSTSIQIIGLTVEEALPEVDRFIDRAILHGLGKVQIIHGIGSGKLREGIHRFLRTHQGVKKFNLGEGIRGGAGITIVEL